MKVKCFSLNYMSAFLLALVRCYCCSYAHNEAISPTSLLLNNIRFNPAITAFDETPNSAGQSLPITTMNQHEFFSLQLEYHITAIKIIISNVPLGFICQFSSDQTMFEVLPNCSLTEAVSFDFSRKLKFNIVKQSANLSSDDSTVYSFTLRVSKPTLAAMSIRHQDLTKPMACSLQNDCNVNVDMAVTCGLQSLDTSWSDFLETTYYRLPYCNSQQSLIDTKGQWVVPCNATCSDYLKCDWPSALWLPSGCRLRTLNESSQHCFENLTIAVVGDSSIRLSTYSMVAYMRNRQLLNSENDPKLHLDSQCYDCFYFPQRNVLFRLFYHNPEWSPCTSGPQKLLPLRHCTFEAAFDVALDWFRTQTILTRSRKKMMIIGSVSSMNETYLNFINQTLREYRKDVHITFPIVLRGHVPSFVLDNKHNLGSSALDQSLKRQADNDKLLNYTHKQFGFTVADAWRPTISRWKEFSSSHCQCLHNPNPSPIINGDPVLNPSLMEPNSIIRAEAELLAEATCLALGHS